MVAAPSRQAKGSDPPGDKLRIDKFTAGPITCLKFGGVLDEHFDGKRFASTVKASTLVLDLADVRKISSFGIREWVDFMIAMGKACDSIILLECAPKVMDQLNMVANFAGKGKVFSFYAPYRCDYCDAESRLLLQVDTDWEIIKSMRPPERPCKNCGEPEYFDEDPATFFSFIANQEPFSLEAKVASFLASKLNYAVSDAVRRLRVDKIIEGRATYLRLAGDLDASFPGDKLAEGLEGTLFLDVTDLGRIDPAGAAEWRAFVRLITPAADAIYIVGAPAAFFEKLTAPEDLGPKAQLVTFAIPYTCNQCATTSPLLIDVEQHFDVLKFATAPEMACPDCKGPVVCAASEALLSHLPALTKPAISREIRDFIKDVQRRKPAATTVAEAARGRPYGGWGLVAAAAAVAAGLAVAAIFVLQYARGAAPLPVRAAVAGSIGQLVERSAPQRPSWIRSQAFFSGDCVVGRDSSLSCLGVSSPVPSREEARLEAQDAAMDALVSTVGERIRDPDWEAVRRIYASARHRQLNAYDRQREVLATGSVDRARYDHVYLPVRNARKAVLESFQATAPDLVPTHADGTYWERYEGAAAGSRYLFFVHYAVAASAVEGLVKRYLTSSSALGANAVTVFPALAWRYPRIVRGAVLTQVGPGELREGGLAADSVIQEIQDIPVLDAAHFATLVNDALAELRKEGGALKLGVHDVAGGGFKIPVARENPRPSATSSRARVRRSSAGPERSLTPWDRNTLGGRDDPRD